MIPNFAKHNHVCLGCKGVWDTCTDADPTNLYRSCPAHAKAAK